MAGQPGIGAHSATGRTKHGLGWVPWVALLLLIVLIAGAILWALNINDDDDDSGVDLNNDSASALVSPLTNNPVINDHILITTGALQ